MLKGMDVKEKNGSRASYLAIVGDVVRSRELEGRGEFQQRLRSSISRVNEEYSSSIASNFILTIGDEFQGLLRSAEKIPQILAVIRSEIHPIEQRVGIGIGKLDTELEAVAIGMDGPCFHRARDAIERAKSSGTSIEVETGGMSEPFRIYALLYSNLRKQWTPRQKQVFDLSMIGITGKAIAQQLRITPSAVSQHLSAVGANGIFEATRIWVEALTRMYNSAE
jgi:DNA-binding CsgD family transcriptional regulator